MYENFYRFTEKPFNLTPDPKFLFLSKHHQGALDHMLYGINQREGFMSIVGDVGTGKTTLCRCLLDRLDQKIQVALILNPMLSDMDLLRTCVHDLEVQPIPAYAESSVSNDLTLERDYSEPVPMSWVNHATKKELIDALNTFLLAQHAEGGGTVLIIDEAQNLPLDVMEQLRILSNLETEKEKLLQIIFVGQLELNDKLNSPELKQLNQRISIRYQISPLSREETAQYINHRILVAGGASRVSFNASAVKEIFKYSQGYPRLINLVCDRALLGGFNDQVDVIDKSQVTQGIQSLMGQEEINHYRNYFIRFRLPIISSLMFFLAGLTFFIFALMEMEIDWRSEFRPVMSKVKVAITSGIKQIPFSDSSGEKGVPSRPETEPEVKPELKSELQPKKDATDPAQTGVADNPPVSEINEAAPEAESMAATQSKSVVAAEGESVASAESESIVAAEADNINAAPAPESSYRIQLYSLLDVSQAKVEVQKLREQGYKAYWKKAVTGDQDWFMVYAGPYMEVQPAKIHVDALKYSGRNPILLSVAKSH